MIKYSIIIPVYNMQQYVSQCIESICYENRQDVEVIVVNDGSNDDTINILNDKKKKYQNLKVINKENSGSMDSWILGVSLSQGKYICFADSDDFVVKDYFSTLDKYIDDSIDILMFDYKKVYKNKIVEIKANNMDYGVISNDSLAILKDDYFGNYELFSFYRWNKVFKRDLLILNLEYINFRVTYFEDLFIGFLSLLLANKVLYIDDKLYNYRVRKSSVTHNPSSKLFLDNRKMKNELFSFMKKNNISDKSIVNMEEYMDYGYIRYFLRLPKNNKIERIEINNDYLKNNPHRNHLKLIKIYKYHLEFLFKMAFFIKMKMAVKYKMYD